MTVVGNDRMVNKKKPKPKPTPKPKPKPKPDPKPVIPVTSSEVIAALNVERAKVGLGALAESSTLDASALSWAQSMAAAGVLTHGDFGQRISAILPGHAASENIAEGQATVAQVVAAWMASDGHRANILGPYTSAGHGEGVDADNFRYWVVDFAA